MNAPKTWFSTAFSPSLRAQKARLRNLFTRPGKQGLPALVLCLAVVILCGALVSCREEPETPVAAEDPAQQALLTLRQDLNFPQSCDSQYWEEEDVPYFLFAAHEEDPASWRAGLLSFDGTAWTWLWPGDPDGAEYGEFWSSFGIDRKITLLDGGGAVLFCRSQGESDAWTPVQTLSFRGPEGSRSVTSVLTFSGNYLADDTPPAAVTLEELNAAPDRRGVFPPEGGDGPFLLDQAEEYRLYGYGNGLILRRDDAFSYFPFVWRSPLDVRPQLWPGDWNGDGTEDVAIWTHAGTGTGVSVDSLFLVDLSAAPWTWQSPDLTTLSGLPQAGYVDGGSSLLVSVGTGSSLLLSLDQFSLTAFEAEEVSSGNYLSYTQSDGGLHVTFTCALGSPGSQEPAFLLPADVAEQDGRWVCVRPRLAALPAP